MWWCVVATLVLTCVGLQGTLLPVGAEATGVAPTRRRSPGRSVSDTAPGPAGHTDTGTGTGSGTSFAGATATVLQSVEAWVESCAASVAAGSRGCAEDAAAMLRAVHGDEPEATPGAAPAEEHAASSCPLKLRIERARTQVREACCAERDELRAREEHRGSGRDVPAAAAATGGDAPRQDVDDLETELLTVRAELQALRRRATDLVKKNKALDRALSDARVHGDDWKSAHARALTQLETTQRAVDAEYQLRLEAEENVADMFQKVYYTACTGCAVTALAVLIAAGLAWWRRRHLCLLFRPRLATTTFDHMLPSFEPLLVQDAEREQYLFACVPLRQLPPTGRGAMLARDGPNGTFMVKAVDTARKMGRRLVVVAYGNINTPPNDTDMQESYVRVCREAIDEVEAEDVVLVWHERVYSDDPGLVQLVEEAQWGSLITSIGRRGE